MEVEGGVDIAWVGEGEVGLDCGVRDCGELHYLDDLVFCLFEKNSRGVRVRLFVHFGLSFVCKGIFQFALVHLPSLCW